MTTINGHEPRTLDEAALVIGELERELTETHELWATEHAAWERELAEANAVIKHLEGAATAWKDKCAALREALQGAVPALWLLAAAGNKDAAEKHTAARKALGTRVMEDGTVVPGENARGPSVASFRCPCCGSIAVRATTKAGDGREVVGCSGYYEEKPGGAS